MPVARLYLATHATDDAVADLAAIKLARDILQKIRAISDRQRRGHSENARHLIIGERERLRRNGLAC